MQFAQANDIWGFLCLVVMVLYGAWQIKEGNKIKLELTKLSLGQSDLHHQMNSLTDARVKSAEDAAHAEGILAGISKEQNRVN